MELLKLSILSPERRLAEGLVVEEVNLPGTQGQVQILPSHAPIVGVLQTGPFSYKKPGSEPVLGVISTGFFEVLGNHVRLMVETLELKGEIDLDRARKAQEMAEETLQKANLDEHQFRKYQLKLQRAIIRQQVAGH